MTVTMIIGPTGIGKSQYAINQAVITGASIISTDAFQVYRGMCIGTGKPSASDQSRVRHHCLDTHTPDQQYTVGDFINRVRGLIDWHRSQSIPTILCGGSALYSYALLQSHPLSPPGDPVAIARLTAQANQTGSASLWQDLQKKYPAIAAQIHPNNTHRIIRALTKPKASPVISSTAQQPAYAMRIIGLWAPRPVIRQRIANRVRAMIQSGWIDEVRQLRQTYTIDCPGFRAIGYALIAQYLDTGDQSHADLVTRIINKTQQFAKRQRTWYRKFDAHHTIDWFKI